MESPVSPDHDVSAYKWIRHFGSMSVSDAAIALGVSQREAADSVERLKMMGLVARSEGDQATFVAVAPEVAALSALTRGRLEIGHYSRQIADFQTGLNRIIDDFMTLGSDTPRQVSIDLMTDLRQVAAYLDNASELAREQVLTMHPTPPPASRLREEGRDRNQRHSGRGLRLRTIYQHNAVSGPNMISYLRELATLGYEIRIAQIAPARVLIFDWSRAVVAVDPVNGSAGAIAIEGELFVRTLVSFFDFCWQHSSMTEQVFAESSDIGLSEREQAILRMLAAGFKDERIARDLGVSLRTVTRTVSDLMGRLGVENRFQAGLRAAACGWID